MTLAAGMRLGPYEILAPLGAGGMGEVYRARDSRLSRDVEGRTLRDIIAPGPIPLRKLLQIGTQVAEGLASAHAGGIVHRDLKPENLMVSRDGFVKILDFGIAKLSEPGAEKLSQVETGEGGLTGRGLLLGTVAYMSPEQAGGHEVDFRSDQFSLGCVLYEMATGRRPFGKESVAGTLTAILLEDPEPLGSVNARLPAPVCWTVERCLAKEPDERYASTRDLARDLAALRDRLLDVPQGAAAARLPDLPPQRTAFVGRVRERAALAELLKRPDVLVVTLTGPGGIGKTRLALEVARDVAEEFPGGVAFVPLAPVGDPEAILPTIAQALGIRGGTSGPPLQGIRERLQALAPRPMLLVLDGFERLVGAASLVSDLMEAGPGCKVLVTSRSPLHIYGEQEFPVPPLTTPDRRSTVDDLLKNDAVSLFVQRAAAVKPSFALTPENASAIAEICARLDGLPLALELAAARVKLLSPAAMRTRFENRLALLTGGARDLPARQQTLRGAIDWSHEFLSPPEQTLFRRLSVFPGGCTLEAAEAVCNATSDLGLDPLEGMESLVDKSLIVQDIERAGDPRFLMFATIREYGLERLAASGEEPLARRAHAAYFLVLAEDLASEHAGGIGAPGPPSASEGPSWLDRFELEHDNLRAALDWLIANGEAEWGLRLGAAMFHFWEEREHLAEGRDRLAQILDLPRARPHTRLRARALFAAGVLAGEPKRAEVLHEEGQLISQELGDSKGVAVALNARAVDAQRAGNLAASRLLLEKSLVIWRELDDRVALVRALSNLANVATLQGSFGEARSLFEECLAISRQLDDYAGMAWALNQQGDVARDQGDISGARSFYERSLAMFREHGDRWGVAGSLADLGNLARDQHDFPTAYRLYRESVAVFRELDHRRGVARLLECFAGAAAAESQPERALKLAGAAAALRQAVGATLAVAEQARLEKSLASARAALSDAAGAAAWMEGWTMPIEGAVRDAAGPSD